MPQTQANFRAMRLLPALFFSALACVSVASCGGDDDDEHKETPAECEAIVEKCHDLDPGSGPIHECHEYAEAGHTAEECKAKQAECFPLCVASDAGSNDAASGD